MTFLPSTAVAAEAGVCASDSRRLGGLRAVRALSLDLRGSIPTAAEYLTMQDAQQGLSGSTREAAEDAVLDGFADTWLASEAFVEQVVKTHRALLLNNISKAALVASSMRILSTVNAKGERVFWRRNAAIASRGGGSGTVAVAVSCDMNSAAVIVGNDIQTTLTATGHNVEGVVEVVPYWHDGHPTLDGTSVKVCAFDAQTAALSRSGTDCRLVSGVADGGCGCGPSLRHCQPAGFGEDLGTHFSAELDARIAQVIRQDLPYSSLFTGQNGFINGPLLHYLKYQRDTPSLVGAVPLSMDEAGFPQIEYNDLEMRPLSYGPHHAGILTSPAFLLRFQTNRARANHFYDAFLCQPFQAPLAGLPSPDDSCSREPDLQQRCGCKYCHSLLEPAAAHWGRWRQNSAGYMAATDFPQERDDCLGCALRGGGGCSRECSREYVVKALHVDERPYLGQLRAYFFRRDEHQTNIDLGPALLAKRSLADNRLPNCVAERTATWLLGRQPGVDDAGWLDELGLQFGQDLSYRQLVRAIVVSSRYRRVR